MTVKAAHIKNIIACYQMHLWSASRSTRPNITSDQRAEDLHASEERLATTMQCIENYCAMTGECPDRVFIQIARDCVEFDLGG